MSGKVKTLDALTGLRFIAAFAVFLHHASGKMGLEKIQWPLGSQAVSFFFVLSGFILTYVYHGRLKVSGLKKFYFTRWARIWPLHCVCLALTLFMFFKVVHFQIAPERGWQLLANIFLLQSWIPDHAYTFSFNGVSWSIATEMFFYLMFPVFLLGGQRKFWYKYAALMIGFAATIVGVTMLSHTELFPTVNWTLVGHTFPLFRLPEFCTGMAVGFLFLNRNAKLAASSAEPSPRNFWLDTTLEFLAFVAIFGWHYSLTSSGFVDHVSAAAWGGPFLRSIIVFTSGCFVFAGMIYLFSSSQGLISRLCSTKFMVFLGEISFAFYMIHMLVIRWANQSFPIIQGISPIIVAGCVALISIAASMLLFKLVEMPFKKKLLLIYDGKFNDGIKVAPKATWAFAKTGLCAITVILFLIPLFTLNRYGKGIPTLAKNKVVQNTEREYRNIRFGSPIILLGFDVKPTKNAWVIEMLWIKTGQMKRGRFMHICDDEENIVAHGPRNNDLFVEAKVGEPFLEKVMLPAKFLKKGSTVGIGFQKKGAGFLMVGNGPRSLNHRRLDLIKPDRFAEISNLQHEKFGNRVSQSVGDPSGPYKIH